MNQDTNGMANIVKNLILAQTVEYGTQLINNVSAQIGHIGADIAAYQSQIALEVNTSIQPSLSVLVSQDSNGMEKCASNVTTAEYGMSLS